ncbi:hypothetical protein BT69DRAFT_1293680 [Atractiella rhizophila]|nr:hypothetical protein BT69DRAFT_1293680 [Atractiella rhizophila]
MADRGLHGIDLAVDCTGAKRAIFVKDDRAYTSQPSPSHHSHPHKEVRSYRPKDPMVLGHDTAGVVVGVRLKFMQLQQGDRVALEPKEACGMQGGQNSARLLRDPKRPNVSREEEAMIEPLSMVQIVGRIGGMKARLNVSICGSGPVRLLAQSAAKALDARKIIAVDIQVWQARFGDCRSSQRIMKEELKVADKGLEGIDLPVDCMGVMSFADRCLDSDGWTRTGVPSDSYLVKDSGTYA